MSLDFSFPFARKILAAVYREGSFYRIPFGPLRGLQFHYDSKMTAHAVLGIQDLNFFSLATALFEKLGWTDSKEFSAFDLGANRGLYSLYLSKYFGKVYAFEPNPVVFEILDQNCKKNHLLNVETVPKAVTEKKGTLELCIGDEDHTGFLKGAQRPQSSFKSQQVATISLDAFAEEKAILPVRFIKIDIEGAGIWALDGAKKLIETHRPVIYFESHSPEEDKSLGDLLLKNNYKAFRVTNSQWVEDASKTHPSKEGVWGNCLVIPNEYMDAAHAVLKSA